MTTPKVPPDSLDYEEYTLKMPKQHLAPEYDSPEGADVDQSSEELTGVSFQPLKEQELELQDNADPGLSFHLSQIKLGAVPPKKANP